MQFERQEVISFLPFKNRTLYSPSRQEKLQGQLKKLRKENQELKDIFAAISKNKLVAREIVSTSQGSITSSKLWHWRRKLQNPPLNTHGGARKFTFNQESDRLMQILLWREYFKNKELTAGEYAHHLSTSFQEDISVPVRWVKLIFKKNGFSFKKGIPYNKRKFSHANIAYYGRYLRFIQTCDILKLHFVDGLKIFQKLISNLSKKKF